MQYAVISGASGKDIAVVAHDPSSARVVFKGPSNSDLYQAFALAYGRPVVIPIEKGMALLRRKIIPSQDEYLRALLSKFVHHPYEVRTVNTAVDSHYRLDSLADKLAQELLEA